MNFDGVIVRWPKGVEAEHDVPRFHASLSEIVRDQGMTFWLRVPARAREEELLAARDLCASVFDIDEGREAPSTEQQQRACTVQLFLFSIRNQVEMETGDFMPPRRASGVCAARL